MGTLMSLSGVCPSGRRCAPSRKTWAQGLALICRVTEKVIVAVAVSSGLISWLAVVRRAPLRYSSVWRLAGNSRVVGVDPTYRSAAWISAAMGELTASFPTAVVVAIGGGAGVLTTNTGL